jgi:cytochrome c oxidase accessory protein FixG
MSGESNVEDFYQFDDEARDHIATVDSKGNRIWVYPKKPKGRMHNYRALVSIVLLALLFAGPFMTIGGRPLLLLNFIERKFVIFGTPFWPQDLHIFAIATITLFVFVILFTAAFGRVWCGWACPQTLFMEMVFRKIEYWIEGDANKQRKLDAGPWNEEKILKKSAKHLIFVAFSILISHTVMAYLIGIDQVKEITSQPPSANLGGFIGLIFFTGIFYWVFAYFREQACTVVCPYGRLQGVLLNKDSLAVSYDFKRGEKRGKMVKSQAQEGQGDCIDCKLCVHACPTGIDIRNGTQLECVNCTACIDACNEVMDKIEKPQGLIRVSSHNGILSGTLKIFSARIAGYSALLLVLVSLLSFLIVNRSDVEITILRVPGQLYQKAEEDNYTNLYNIQFINKTFDPVTLNVSMKGEGQIERVGEGEIIVPANGQSEGVFFVKIHESRLEGYKTRIDLIFKNSKGEELERKTNFLGPATKIKK